MTGFYRAMLRRTRYSYGNSHVSLSIRPSVCP